MTGIDFVSWYGLWGPKGLPADITAKLQAEVAAIVSAAGGARSAWRCSASSRSARSTAYFTKYIDDEMAKYAKIIKDANIKAE